MDFRLIAFGKLRIPGIQESFNYYEKAAKRMVAFEHVELKAAPGGLDRAVAQARDEELFLKALDSTSHRQKRLILLDERGKSKTTEDWAEFLKDWRDRIGVQETVFGIGSAYGFSDALRNQADGLFALGPQTLPHELARVVTMEQIYRVLTVWKGHPYHHGSKH